MSPAHRLLGGLKRVLRSDALNRFPHALNRDKLAVLCYHGVVPERLPPDHPQHPLTIAVDDFAEQLQPFVREKYGELWKAICVGGAETSGEEGRK